MDMQKYLRSKANISEVTWDKELLTALNVYLFPLLTSTTLELSEKTKRMEMENLLMDSILMKERGWIICLMAWNVYKNFQTEIIL